MHRCCLSGLGTTRSRVAASTRRSGDDESMPIDAIVLMQKYCVPGRCASGAAAADAAAKKALEAVFADRTVVALDMYPVNLGGGGVHCYTHQQPAL